MELMMIAGMLLHPAALAVLFLVVIAASIPMFVRKHVKAPFTVFRLIQGYVGALLAVAVIAFLISYVGPEEAQKTWNVPPEYYVRAVLNRFIALFTLLAYCTLLVIALVGAPVVYTLSRRGFGTVPRALLAAVVLSLLTAVPLYFGGVNAREGRGLAAGAVALHAFACLGLCVGLRLPWRRSRGARVVV